ncbi:hypothetical protein J2S07_001234 [Robertmurraya andreesenii]|uniref:Uncharacterized protein n=1 Tax=Anoxybacillus andreesenii TaxID=1325932 RepID=A0ABT9V1V3_9BACL|nr:hypothetical protein [Robertmurraya andreesenii]
MIKCPVCRRMFINKDRVVLDIYNSITHQDCFTGHVSTIKDFSSYSNIINSYSIFADVKSPTR